MRPWLAALLVGIATSAAPAAVPSFDAVRAAHQSSDVQLVDRRGEPLQSVRIDMTARRGVWLPLERFSPALREAVVQAEDRRFWAHGGVDWQAVIRSAAANVDNAVDNAMDNAVDTAPNNARPIQGASTLTMQLAALLDADLARPAGGRSLVQKLHQIEQARQFEARWSKAQILEAYLNRVPLRGEWVGMPAAAGAMFGKHPSGLDRNESALLAALLRAPNAPRDTVVRRACALVGTASRCEALAGLAERALARSTAAPASEQLSPHFARWVLTRPGLRAAQKVSTTLDARVQRQAIAALRGQLAELGGRNVEDGAVLVLDNASGQVRAWVGSSGGQLSGAPEVDAVLARRQPGSTIKPFVYALALEQSLITPASLLHDAPADLDGGGGASFAPRNYDRRYRGWVSARSALAASLNVPTARLAVLLGPEALFDRLNAAGLQLDHSAGHHGLALALGSADVSLLNLTNAYRALANGGQWSPVTGVADTKATPASRRLFDARSAFQIGDILSDASARAATFGLDSALVTRGFAAVKTGTSKDMRDNWCIGYTDRFTVGVWVGNAGGAAMHHVSGTQGAAPVWRALVTALHAGEPSRAPRPPAGLASRRVEFDAAIEPARDEWMAEDAQAAARADVALQPMRVRGGEQVGQARASGIASPRDGSIFALDPDMPAPVQRIRFRGEPGEWWLDGQRIGSGAQLAWAPWPGRHRLELKAGGAVIDRVAFEVRGASVARQR